MLSGIPEATNRKPICLIVVIPVDITKDVTQGAVPGIVREVLRRTPPETEVANEVECPIVVTGTARKT